MFSRDATIVTAVNDQQRMVEKQNVRLALVVRRWAKLGDREPERRSAAPSWEAIAKLIDAARKLDTVEGRRLKRLASLSNRRLRPFHDPLYEDFGAHGWLASRREEVYTAWFVWLLDRLGRGPHVCDILGVTDPTLRALAANVQPSFHTEFSIPAGRIDILIRFAKKASAVVEIKVIAAEDADTEKHRRYLRELRRKEEPVRDTVLIASRGEEAVFHGFRLRTWRSVCQELRRVAVDLVQDRRTVLAAMVLAFVGAIERNILKLHSLSGEERGGMSIYGHAEVVEHLQGWLREGV